VDDLLVFYTDGIVEEEAPDAEIFNQERLAQTLIQLRAQPPKELLANVLDEIRRFAGHRDFSDDVCLLAVEIKQLEIKS
jgi:serine phosphatase RsbU (regulator of sigma subunit)